MGKPSPDWLPLLFNAVFSFKGPSTLMWNEPSEIYPQMSLMYFEHDFKVWHFLVLGCNQTRPIVLLWCNWPHGHMIPRLHLPIFFEFMRRIMPSIRHIMDHWGNKLLASAAMHIMIYLILHHIFVIIIFITGSYQHQLPRQYTTSKLK